MGKVCRVKQRTKVYRKRRGFNGNISTVNNNVGNAENVPENNVNTESNISVDNESNTSVSNESNNIYVNSQSEINLSVASVLSQKVQHFEASTPQEEEE